MKKIRPQALRVIVAVVLILVIGIGAAVAFLLPKKEDGTGGLFGGGGGGKSEDTVSIGTFEFAPYANMLSINGGIETAKDSILDKAGMNVSYEVFENDPDAFAALASGNIQGLVTVMDTYVRALANYPSLDMKVVALVDRSTGADSIVGKAGMTIEDMAKPGKQIGYAPFSPGETLLMYIGQTKFNDAQFAQFKENLVPFDEGPSAAAAAFLAPKAELDAVAIWEPDITNCINNGAIDLFSTSEATNLILDVLIFRTDFIESDPDFVKNYVKAIIEESQDGFNYTNIDGFIYYAEEGKEDIPFYEGKAKEGNWTENKKFILDGTGKDVFYSLADIWITEQQAVKTDAANSFIWPDAVQALEGQFEEEATTPFVVDPEIAAQEDNQNALIQVTSYVQFIADDSKFLKPEEAYAELDEFVRIAKVIDGTVIKIDGHTNPVSSGGDGKQLSLLRAKQVKNYFVSRGIDPDRIIVTGYGDTKPAGEAQENRRVEISFMNNGA